MPSVDIRSRTATGTLGFAAPDRASAVFGALADPTRRRLLEALATNGEATATELAATFPVTRQMIVKHLGVLAGAGLVSSRRVGKEQRFALQPVALEAATAWVASVGAAWDARLARLKGRLSP